MKALESAGFSTKVLFNTLRILHYQGHAWREFISLFIEFLVESHLQEKASPICPVWQPEGMLTHSY